MDDCFGANGKIILKVAKNVWNDIDRCNVCLMFLSMRFFCRIERRDTNSGGGKTERRNRETEVRNRTVDTRRGADQLWSALPALL